MCTYVCPYVRMLYVIRTYVCIAYNIRTDGEVAVDVLYVPHLMCVLLVHVRTYSYIRTLDGPFICALHADWKSILEPNSKF